ncbi:hypothetical protein GCM10022243_19430 [Saccharothrix violaceirubra]|uniref:Transcriptional regulator with XRE-family HTH domain n=1 Tax=Saccharothrix violaceirubra TaxID=413306 RepID=A0A7W7WVC1_9PSEU|nr:helix-turn-helix transcriptional regulator [Saccharothrix violaceirubra]MBB4965150.1 transcriptional regulator with XRE-family HTH domain [Saccharothrix violaceirubra]
MNDDQIPPAPESAGEELARQIRQRRDQAGLSQPKLARLIGYTRQYVSRAERPNHNLPSIDLVRALDTALDARGALVALREKAKEERINLRMQTVEAVADSDTADTRPDSPFHGGTRSEQDRESMRARSSHDDVRPHHDRSMAVDSAIFHAAASVERLHRDYQAAQYAEVEEHLPEVADTVEALLADSGGDRRRLLRLRCQAAVVHAKVATKRGDGITAFEAAERARHAAEEAGDPFGRASAAYQLSCALIRLDDAERAESHALDTADSLRGHDPHTLTWQGMTTLLAAVLAARDGDIRGARQRLDRAGRLAEALRGEVNIGHTAFGPTNVSIHRVGVAVAVGDPDLVLAEAAEVDVTVLPPGLHGRRGRFHLDNAWAHTRRREDALAVIHLLEAERFAPQLVATDCQGKAVLRELLSRERVTRTPGLRPLGVRTGVIA